MEDLLKSRKEPKNAAVPGLQTGASSQITARRKEPTPNSCSSMEAAQHQCQGREGTMASNTKKMGRAGPRLRGLCVWQHNVERRAQCHQTYNWQDFVHMKGRQLT